MSTPQFTLGRSHSTEAFTAQQIAEAIVAYSGVKVGCICACMSYMHGFSDTVKYESAAELTKALLDYCEKYDTSSFDHRAINIIFVRNGRLRKMSITVAGSAPRRDLEQLLQRHVFVGGEYDAQAYEKAHQVTLDRQDMPDERVFLPPVYNGAGKHVGGGVPGVRYNDL